MKNPEPMARCRRLTDAASAFYLQSAELILRILADYFLHPHLVHPSSTCLLHHRPRLTWPYPTTALLSLFPPPPRHRRRPAFGLYARRRDKRACVGNAIILY